MIKSNTKNSINKVKQDINWKKNCQKPDQELDIPKYKELLPTNRRQRQRL